MDKRLLGILIFAIFVIIVLIYGYTQQDQNSIQSNLIQNNTAQNSTQNDIVQDNSGQINVNNTLKDYGATITQIGPNNPQKRGTSVPIYYTVTNKGKKTIYDAEVGAQEFVKYIGTLKPGQTKKYTYMQYIPTDQDLAEWYEGGNVKLTGPLEIGSIILTFKDAKGVLYSVRSNQIEIKLSN